MTDWVKALTLGDIIGVLVALGVVVGGLRWLKPVLTGVHDFLADWGGEPERPGVPPRPGVVESLGQLRCDMEGVKTDLAKVKDDAAQAAFHSQPNHGTSSHDALMREVKHLSGQMSAVTRAIELSVVDRAEIRAHIGMTPIDEQED